MTSIIKKEIFKKLKDFKKLDFGDKQTDLFISLNSRRNFLINKINYNINSLEKLNNHLSYLIREIDESTNKR